MKNTCNASQESKGFCFYKATNGIKRHLAIDTLGFPFFTHSTGANLSDDAGLIEMLTLNIDYFKSKQARYCQDHHPARSRVSPRIFDSEVRADLPGGMERCKILVNNFERTLAGATAKLNLCS